MSKIITIFTLLIIQTTIIMAKFLDQFGNEVFPIIVRSGYTNAGFPDIKMTNPAMILHGILMSNMYPRTEQDFKLKDLMYEMGSSEYIVRNALKVLVKANLISRKTLRRGVKITLNNTLTDFLNMDEFLKNTTIVND
jgi:hypothetical protein